MSRRSYKAIPIVVLLLGAAVAARAQWETPNRAFHNATSFPLEGRHLAVACEACHVNGVLKGTPNTCFSCHWIRRQDDRYALRLGAQCEQCHRPTSWTETRWNHAASTGVPLNMAHQTLGCDTCHKGGQFKAANLSCMRCHQADYNATKSPNHAAAGFPTTCETCHKPSDATFTQARFDHSAFPLVGVHASTSCDTCHRGNVYKGTTRDCVGCHRSDYDATKTPSHSAAGFPTTCDTCHRPNAASWTAAGTSFNHTQFFQLVGVHATQACAACHQNNQFHGTSRDCVGCHRPQYEQAKNPNHAAAGFPTTCEQCHQAASANWGTGAFNHNQFFQLVGVHAQQACASCHRSEQYKGTPRDCVGCHRTDYDRSQNPNHAASGFSTTCETCHQATSASWRGAGFNHNQAFQLVGVHATQACTRCHVNGVYKGTPRDCYGCHRTQYERTTNPNHAGSGFSTTCEQCHKATDASWNQGTFNHRFPRTGPHNVQCASCHLNPVNYREFSCTVCHGRSETDSKHRGRTGYVYDSAACYSCHPTGRD